MAIRQPGMFLSQPPIATRPSNASQPATVSMESAITSRETSEYFIPSVPMEMPSEIVIVPKMTGLPPAASTPVATSRASLSMCMLHGVTMLQVDAIPTCDFLKSAFENPTACSIARLAARSTPSVTILEYCRCPDLRVFMMSLPAVPAFSNDWKYSAEFFQCLEKRDRADGQSIRVMARNRLARSSMRSIVRGSSRSRLKSSTPKEATTLP